MIDACQGNPRLVGMEISFRDYKGNFLQILAIGLGDTDIF